MNINQIAADCHYMMFWKTPYRTGNLALNGITDVGTYGTNRAGFGLYPGVGTQYGKILNEVPVTIVLTIGFSTMKGLSGFDATSK